MTLSNTYVDGFLAHWDENEYRAEVISNRQVSREIRTEITVPGSTAGRARALSTASRAQAVRERLARTVRRVPEVMVKIYSSCRGMKHIGRHIDYISRKGQIELEDQDGQSVHGKDRLKDLKDDWRIGGPEEIGDESARRDTLNIVLSMPADTDEVSMKRAVRAFAASAFEGHQYVFAYHTQATDPDPNPPPHPHVHLSVKTLGWSGRRLNPRKADLQRWREGFAKHLRAHGIDANATSRLARLQKERGDKRSVHALKAKGEDLHSVGQGAGHERTTEAERLERRRKDYYRAIIEVLAQSGHVADRRLASEVETHFGLGPGIDPASPEVAPRGQRGR